MASRDHGISPETLLVASRVLPKYRELQEQLEQQQRDHNTQYTMLTDANGALAKDIAVLAKDKESLLTENRRLEELAEAQRIELATLHLRLGPAQSPTLIGPEPSLPRSDDQLRHQSSGQGPSIAFNDALAPSILNAPRGASHEKSDLTTYERGAFIKEFPYEIPEHLKATWHMVLIFPGSQKTLRGADERPTEGAREEAARPLTKGLPDLASPRNSEASMVSNNLNSLENTHGALGVANQMAASRPSTTTISPQRPSVPKLRPSEKSANEAARRQSRRVRGKSPTIGFDKINWHKSPSKCGPLTPAVNQANTPRKRQAVTPLSMKSSSLAKKHRRA